MALRLVFFGTPAFAVPSLRALAASPHQVAGVVTQPDRPRGRGQKVSPSPVKEAAIEIPCPVYQPARLRDEGFLQLLRSLQPDLGVVVAYGRILSDELLALPRLGMINVHASLLPRWRGAAPVHRAIIAGDAITGISIMRVVKELDAGPTLTKVSTPIDPDETSGQLEGRLATIGAELLVPVIDALEQGTAVETPQDPSLVTYASRLERRDGIVDFTRPAVEVHNRIRGLQPWPGVAVVLRGKRMRLLTSEVLPLPSSLPTPPGRIARVEEDSFVVATGDGLLRITRVQLEGRAPVPVRDFLNGHTVQVGDSLDLPSPGE